MQVKKFEAKTMKDALQLVKQELGPEAIILSAKDNKKYGLAGGGSVEITAAISERSLQKRKIAENHIAEKDREKFRSQSAKAQKQFIENTLTKKQERAQARTLGAFAASATPSSRRLSFNEGLGATAKKPITTRRYIDINDEDEMTNDGQISGRRVEDLLAEINKGSTYIEDDSAGQTAAKPARAARAVMAPEAPVVAAEPQNTAAAASNQDVNSLRKEVDALRELLAQFQTGAGREPVTRHPGAEYGLPFEFSSNFEKLQQAGVDNRYIVEILEKANEELTPLEKKKKSLVDAWVARYLLSHTSVTGMWIKPNFGVQAHLFVGPSGHGKTSALVKIASHLVLNEKKKVAILTADTVKVGAAEQLKIYSQILNVPFETVKNVLDFNTYFQKYGSYDAVLVDYPGLSLRDMAEIDQIRALMPQRDVPKQTHLVLSCASKDLDAYDICHRYQVTHFNDILLTKVDESYVHGLLYNVQRKTEKSLYAFGIGQKIPEDIELATRERVLDLIYKITKTK
jgi:flagellar biosynthesis protein FlhF